MPLKEGSSDETVHENISREMHAHPEMEQDQAVAIAMKKAGRSNQDEAGDPVPPAATARTREPAEIFSVPQLMPSGKMWGREDLDQVVKNWNDHQAKGDPRFPRPPAYLIPQASVGLGHNDDQSIARAYAERSDLPAVGWPVDVHREGDKLVCYFEGVPAKLAEWVNAGAYKQTSAEFYEDYGGLGPCLRRVALLGADIPARKDLADLPVLHYDPRDAHKAEPVAFTEALATFAKSHPGAWALALPGPGPGLVVTFSETGPGGPAVTPQQQAIVDALAAAGVDVSKLDGAAIDSIIKAVTAGAAPGPVTQTEPTEESHELHTPSEETPHLPAATPIAKLNDSPGPPPRPATMNDSPGAHLVPANMNDVPKAPGENGNDEHHVHVHLPAKQTENGNGKKEEPVPAQFSEATLKRLIAAATAPLQAQLKHMDTVLAGHVARQTAADKAADRAEVAAFVEKLRMADKVYPYELDPKVGPTLVDRLLALPRQPVATFAEGRMSPRAAEMKALDNRPPVARFAEKMKQELDMPEQNSRAAVDESLEMTELGRAAKAKRDRIERERARAAA